MDLEGMCSQEHQQGWQISEGAKGPFLALLSPQVLSRIMGKAYCSIPVLRVWILCLFC